MVKNFFAFFVLMIFSVQGYGQIDTIKIDHITITIESKPQTKKKDWVQIQVSGLSDDQQVMIESNNTFGIVFDSNSTGYNGTMSSRIKISLVEKGVPTATKKIWRPNTARSVKMAEQWVGQMFSLTVGMVFVRQDIENIISII